MDVFVKMMNQIVSLLPAWVALLESTLGVEHPAVAQMRDATASLQAAHEAASNALPKA